MLDVMVAINAAEFLVWGYSANRAINHFEWTNRKIDMSAGGGANSGGWAGDELRRRVAARMAGTTPGPGPGPTPDPEKDDDVYQLVRNENDGSLWACGVGHFQYLSTPEQVEVAQGCGVLTTTEKVTNNRGLDVLRDVCLTPNYEGLPSAMVPN
jgi:hypothetical protein